VISAKHLRSNLLVKLGEVTGRTHILPLVLFAPTSRCNSRCVSCDWWRSDGATDLTIAEIRKLADDLRRYGTQGVVFTGGEPLLRPDVMEIADLFLERGFKLHLLSSGLALERFAPAIATRFGEVTVSLDGHTPELYREIRGVAGLDAILAGVRRMRELAPHIPLRARSTIHRLNFRFLGPLIAKAIEAGFDQVSFLAADVTSDAFNRTQKLRVLDAATGGDEPRALILSAEETAEMAAVVEEVIAKYARELDQRRVVPGPEGLRRLVRYYGAHLGQGSFPAVDCNAPWTSVVIEANGAVRPCFFHAPVGNLRERPLDDLLTQAMPSFRRGLNVATDATCQRCVCTLKVGLRSKVW
jgi:MoaA/NifB/PqqE/SkfB family radical SAM enzyme